MIYQFGAASIKKLIGVHPRLVAVVMLAIQKSKQDFYVDCGVRTVAEQTRLYAQGRTEPGKIVTWTLNSRHIPAVDGYGHAVDLVPYPPDWSDLSKFDAIAVAMMAAALELKTTIRWGANWDSDKMVREKSESDNPHFELT